MDYRYSHVLDMETFRWMFDLLLFRSVFIIALSIVYFTRRDLYMYRAMFTENRKNDIKSASEWQGMC